MPGFSDRLQFALELASRASELILRYYQVDGLIVESKLDESPVTVADRGAEQMMRQMGPRMGQGPSGDVPRDPLGRPQRSEGPDFGNSVKVPDEADAQRAREILEELRRRLSDPLRPTLELDYIERLLRRF